jgi:hypothetical protein
MSISNTHAIVKSIKSTDRESLNPFRRIFPPDTNKSNILIQLLEFLHCIWEALRYLSFLRVFSVPRNKFGNIKFSIFWVVKNVNFVVLHYGIV